MTDLRALFSIGLAGAALATCDRGSSGAGPGASAAPSATTLGSPAASAAPANEGTDPKSPVLAPDDVSFVDNRKGRGWGDRCFSEIKEGKLGWARAACDRGLAMPDLDRDARPSLLYNEGLIAKKGGDVATARAYFQQSIDLRPMSDPGRAIVQRDLDSIGGGGGTAAVPSPTSVQATPFHCQTGAGTKETIVIDFDMRTMSGDISIDAPHSLLHGGAARRFRVHALPHAATYSLMFTGYEPSDKTPSGERFAPDQSIVARVVAAGDDNRIYFDGDYAPPTPPPGGFFLCER